MQLTKSAILAIFFLAVASFDGAIGFMITSANKTPMTVQAQRNASDVEEVAAGISAVSRRDVLFGAMATVSAAAMASPQPAEARYSTYTRHEQDWAERQGNYLLFYLLVYIVVASWLKNTDGILLTNLLVRS